MLILNPAFPLTIILFSVSVIAKAIYTQTLFNTTDLVRYGFERPSKNTSMSVYIAKILKNKNIDDSIKSHWKTYKHWNTIFKILGWIMVIDLLSFFMALIFIE